MKIRLIDIDDALLDVEKIRDLKFENFRAEIEYENYIFQLKLEYVSRGELDIDYAITVENVDGETDVYLNLLLDTLTISGNVEPTVGHSRYNKDNFFEETKVTFQNINKLKAKDLAILFERMEEKDFDYESEVASGSKYIYFKDFVVRYSDHGGRVATCEGDLEKGVFMDDILEMPEFINFLEKLYFQYEKKEFEEDDIVGYFLEDRHLLTSYTLDFLFENNYKLAFAYGDDFEHNEERGELSSLTKKDIENLFNEKKGIKIFDILIEAIETNFNFSKVSAFEEMKRF